MPKFSFIHSFSQGRSSHQAWCICRFSKWIFLWIFHNLSEWCSLVCSAAGTVEKCCPLDNAACHDKCPVACPDTESSSFRNFGWQHLDGSFVKSPHSANATANTNWCLGVWLGGQEWWYPVQSYKEELFSIFQLMILMIPDRNIRCFSKGDL